MTFELLSQFSVTSKTSMAMCTAIIPPWCVGTWNAVFSIIKLYISGTYVTYCVSQVGDTLFMIIIIISTQSKETLARCVHKTSWKKGCTKINNNIIVTWCALYRSTSVNAVICNYVRICAHKKKNGTDSWLNPDLEYYYLVHWRVSTPFTGLILVCENFKTV